LYTPSGMTGDEASALDGWLPPAALEQAVRTAPAAATAAARSHLLHREWGNAAILDNRERLIRILLASIPDRTDGSRISRPADSSSPQEVERK
jgi:hypothetical protein